MATRPRKAQNTSTRVDAAPASSARAEAACVVVVNGGVVARVAKQALVIGRAEECGLVLGDISVSRHCSKPGALQVVTPEYLGVKGDPVRPAGPVQKGRERRLPL